MAAAIIHHSHCARHWSKCFVDTYFPTTFAYEETELREVKLVDEEVTSCLTPERSM